MAGTGKTTEAQAKAESGLWRVVTVEGQTGNAVDAVLGGGCICGSFLSFSHLGIMALDNRRSSVCHAVVCRATQLVACS